MKRILNLRIFVIATLIIVCAATAGIVVLAIKEQKKPRKVIVENKTNSLVVKSIEELGTYNGSTRFSLTVQNKGEKPISAYSIGISDNKTNKNSISRIEINGAVNNWSLESGNVNNTPFSASSEGEVSLTIVAAMFEDGSGEGITNDLTRLQEVRAGAILALNQIVPILQSINNENFAANDAIEALSNKIEALNDNTVPENLRRGYMQTMHYFKLELKDIKTKAATNSNFDFKSEINNKATKTRKVLGEQEDK